MSSYIPTINASGKNIPDFMKRFVYRKRTLTTSGFVENAPVHIIPVTNMPIFLNGINQPYYWTGSSTDKIYPLGLDAPSTPSYSTGAGSLTGKYKYVITWVDKNGKWTIESNPSSPTAEIDVTNGAVTLDISSLTVPQWATHWRVYRSYTEDYSAYYYLAEIAIGTTSYTDDGTYSDADLGDAIVSEHTRFPKASFGIWFMGRVFLAGIDGEPNKLIFSPALKPWGYDAETGYRLIGDASPITGLVGLNNVIFVFKSNTIFAISGIEDGTDALWIRDLQTGIGTNSFRSIVKAHNLIFFFCEKPLGIFAFNGREVTKISSPIVDQLKELNEEELRNCWAVYDAVNDALRFFFPPSSKCFVYTFERKAWYIWDTPNAVNIGADVNFLGHRFVMGGTIDGYLVEFDQDDSNADYTGDNIICYFTTPSYDFGEPHNRKRLKRLWIITDDPPSSSVDVTIDVWFDRSKPTATPDFSTSVTISAKKNVVYIDRSAFNFVLRFSWEGQLSITKLIFEVDKWGKI